jgi:hypothetical protein
MSMVQDNTHESTEELFTKSAEVYRQLAGANLQRGDKELAIDLLRVSWKLKRLAAKWKRKQS